jgi:putative transposase
LSDRFVERGYSGSVVASAFGLHRSTLYRNHGSDQSIPMKEPDIDEALALRIRCILDEEETFGYRRVWAHLRFKEGMVVNIKKIHRIIKLKGWQCRLWNRPGRKGLKVERKRSVVDRPDTLWSTDLTKIYCGRDGWCPLIGVIDNGSREVVGYRFNCRGRALEATDALNQAVMAQYGSREAVPEGLSVRHDNGSIFLARDYIASTKYWGIDQEYIPTGKPDWNGVIERFFRTLKQECVWLHRFESFEHAEFVIARWIENYNKNRLHSSLGYKAPEQWRKEFYELPQAA